MGDLTVFLVGGFAGTETDVAAVSEKGRAFMAEAFGAGAVSARVPRSGAMVLEEMARRAGLKLEAK